MRRQFGIGIAAGLIASVMITVSFGQPPKGERGQRADAAPKVADAAPMFKLKSLDGKSETDLAEVCKAKPVVLIFGSYTWPPFLSQVGSLEAMYQKYGDIAEFRMVYIKEAHAADGDWPMPLAKEKGINNHKSYSDRCTTAEMLFSDKQLTIPCLIDDMKDTVNNAYSGWPDRIFVVRTDGKLGVAGERGPRGFKPALDETEKWLAEFKKSGQQPELSAEAIEAAKKRKK